MTIGDTNSTPRWVQRQRWGEVLMWQVCMQMWQLCTRSLQKSGVLEEVWSVHKMTTKKQHAALEQEEKKIRTADAAEI